MAKGTENNNQEIEGTVEEDIEDNFIDTELVIGPTAQLYGVQYEPGDYTRGMGYSAKRFTDTLLAGKLNVTDLIALDTWARSVGY